MTARRTIAEQLWHLPLSRFATCSNVTVTQTEPRIRIRRPLFPPSPDLPAPVERPDVHDQRAMDVLTLFFDLHRQLRVAGDAVEILLGDGWLRWRRAAGLIDHPVLLQRVELEFDHDEREFRVVATGRDPELYEALLLDAGLTPERVTVLQSKIEMLRAHPLAGEATNQFLEELARELGPRATCPDSWIDPGDATDPAIVRDAVLLVRYRSRAEVDWLTAFIQWTAGSQRGRGGCHCMNCASDLAFGPQGLLAVIPPADPARGPVLDRSTLMTLADTLAEYRPPPATMGDRDGTRYRIDHLMRMILRARRYYASQPEWREEFERRIEHSYAGAVLQGMRDHAQWKEDACQAQLASDQVVAEAKRRERAERHAAIMAEQAERARKWHEAHPGGEQ